MKSTLLILNLLALTSCGWFGHGPQAAVDDPVVQNLETVVAPGEETVAKVAVTAETIPAEEPETPVVEFEIVKIDSAHYFAAKRRAPTPLPTPEKITDLRQAKEMLAGLVRWVDGIEREDIVDGLIARNGKKADEYHEEGGFVAYYPQEDIVLLEGGHTSDVSFDLTTGETTGDAGNPENVLFSPSRLHRLNGWFGGQQCYTWFIQTKTGAKYRKTVQLGKEFEAATGVWLCTLDDVFWLSDTELYFVTAGLVDHQWKEGLYYKVVLR
jgi:hypothetical protein